MRPIFFCHRSFLVPALSNNGQHPAGTRPLSPCMTVSKDRELEAGRVFFFRPNLVISRPPANHEEVSSPVLVNLSPPFPPLWSYRS